MKQFLAAAMVTILALSFLAGCTANGDSANSRPPETAEDASSADLTQAGANSVVAYVGTAIFDGSLDPVKGAMCHGYPFTNAALLRVAPSSEYVGDMATAWTVSDDALVYTFDLRQDVRFSDGTPMTAADVVFTYETVQDRQAENEEVDLTRLLSVTALGDHQVEFTLSEPYSPFLDTTAMLGIVPAGAYDSETFDFYPIGTGPWKVVQYDASQQIIVEPNEHFYGDAPAIARITLVNLDNDTALSAARSGQLDIVMVNPDYALETVDGMALVPFETMDIRMVSLPVQPEQEQDGKTVGNNVTSDASVRRALTIGIDRATIIQNAYNGVGRPAAGFTDNLIWADSAAVEDGRKDEAAALLDDAGWVLPEGASRREKAGVACEFDIYTSDDRYALAAALAEEAAALGIQINVHASSWDEIAANMNTQGVMWGWGQFSPTVIDSLFASRHVTSGGYDNVVGYRNDEVDEIIANALSADNQADAVALWKQAQAVANTELPYLYLVNVEHCYFVADGLDLSVDTQIPHPHGHGAPIICNMKDWTWK